MKISLVDWLKIESILREMRRTIEVADSQISEVFFRYHALKMDNEAKLLMSISEQVHSLRQQSTLGAMMNVHPQSEWMGGDSDDPKNHKLREPNCCPMPRRHFTQEEMEEAGALCHGPVYWTFKKD